jgi:hypothetical protein
MKTTIYPLDYDERIEKYNKQVSELEKQRKEFYEKNPSFPIKTMFMNVIAPPQKLILKEG